MDCIRETIWVTNNLESIATANETDPLMEDGKLEERRHHTSSRILCPISIFIIANLAPP